MKPYTIAQQMARFGIPDTETGPYVTELRGLVARKLREGMIYQSAGSCTEEFWKLPYEEQAKHRLAWDWALDRQHSYRVECMDRLIYRGTNVLTGKRTFKIHWRSIPAWIGDRFRQLGCKYRVWRDRAVANPYL